MVRFVTFEGGDGTGKTTQIHALEKYLARHGCANLVTREPGGTALGATVRQVLLEASDVEIAPSTEIFLYLADRAQHVSEVIRPALAAGKVVLCDRYSDSTLAYQGYGRGVGIEVLRPLNGLAEGGVHPDLTILLDCPVILGLARIAQRKGKAGLGPEDRFEQENIEFHERVRTGFLDLARAEPERFRIVDAALPVDEVRRTIQTIADREIL